MGPDADILVDPEKTMSLGKPVGKDSSLEDLERRSVEDRRRFDLGLYGPTIPKLNLFYYGTGNPSTWNPAQRAGPDGKPIDQKWSMTMFARNPDTGVAAWAYQMTPFDEWDYDGINENDPRRYRRRRQEDARRLVHFDRNGFGYTLDRKTGELLVAQKYDPKVNWATGVDHGSSEPDSTAVRRSCRSTRPSRTART